MINRFEEFNLDKNIIKSLKNIKYEIPSKVQSKVIPQLLNNKDIIKIPINPNSSLIIEKIKSVLCCGKKR